jgi:Overcoming lysogenization defect protein-like, TOPRIM domain
MARCRGVATSPLSRLAPVAPDAVILVEGVSDQLAVEALAARRGHDLAAKGVTVVPIGGAGNIRHFLDRFIAQRIRVAGLCDAGEEDDFRLAVERAGLGPELGQAGFYVCDADLEDELIRCLGATRVERIVEDEGELGRFRTFQKQPAQRARTIEAQLRRFMGTRAGRKIQYAPLLVGALDLARVPRPLDGVLAHI